MSEAFPHVSPPDFFKVASATCDKVGTRLCCCALSKTLNCHSGYSALEISWHIHSHRCHKDGRRCTLLPPLRDPPRFANPCNPDHSHDPSLTQSRRRRHRFKKKKRSSGRLKSDIFSLLRVLLLGSGKLGRFQNDEWWTAYPGFHLESPLWCPSLPNTMTGGEQAT